MIFIGLGILLFLVLFGIKYTKPKTFFEDNMSPEKTSSMNGLFVMIVFFSHIKNYFVDMNVYDKAFYSLPIIFTQLIVVSFLFYSGYGMMESTKKKGFTYIQSIPKKRFPKLFIDFAIAILLFIITNLCLGKTLDLKNTLLAFTGWTAIGNSNWYIFAIFCFYIIMYLSFLICKNKSNVWAVTVTTILSIGFIIGISFVKQGYWYNTFLCLPFGMWFSLCKEKILAFFKRKYYNYLIVSFLTLTAFVLLYIFVPGDPFVFNVTSILFAMLLVLGTLKLSIHNKILNWLGKYTFWIYILQRIPMNVLKQVGLPQINNYLYFFVCLIITILLAILFKYLSSLIEKLIWRKGKPKIEAQPTEKA